MDTLQIALEAMGISSVPIVRSWYLNERHFGALQGMRHLEAILRFGPLKVWACQRRYASPPPPLSLDDPRHPSRDERYAALAASDFPASESLRDTVDRLRPFWTSTLAPEVRKGSSVLVVAHKNSLRALMRLLDATRDEDVPRLSIRTGRPLLFKLDPALSIVQRRYLDDAPSRHRASAAGEPAAPLRNM